VSVVFALMLVATEPAAPSASVDPTPATQVANEDSELDICIKTSKGTNAEYRKCYGDGMQRADDRLNAVWKVALADVGGRNSDGGRALVKEQRIWIKFKEQACGFYWTRDFGSLHRSIIGPACALDIVKARISQLEDISSFFDRYRGEDK